MTGLAYITTFAGAYDDALALLEEAEALAETNNLAWGRSVVAFVRGILSALRDDAAAARRQLQQSLAICRAVGDPRHVGLMLNYLGTTALALGQLVEAERICRESLAMSLDRQDGYQRGLALHSLGRVMLARGRCCFRLRAAE